MQMHERVKRHNIQQSIALHPMLHPQYNVLKFTISFQCDKDNLIEMLF